MRTPLALDTPLDVEARQVERWRTMTSAEKGRLITALCQSVHDLAWAGLKRRYPGASERELFLRMAVLRLGGELARKVHPDVATLADDRTG